MAHPPQAPTQAAGIFIALFTIAGAVIGNANGQPSLGLVLGAGAGIAVALGYWVLKK